MGCRAARNALKDQRFQASKLRRYLRLQSLREPFDKLREPGGIRHLNTPSVDEVRRCRVDAHGVAQAQLAVDSVDRWGAQVALPKGLFVETPAGEEIELDQDAESHDLGAQALHEADGGSPFVGP